MSNNFKLSRGEELVFRELGALSGDFQQLAENLVRHHKEREEQAKRQAEAMAKGGGALAMAGLNVPALLTDLRFLRDRVSLLIDYLAPEQKPG